MRQDMMDGSLFQDESVRQTLYLSALLLCSPLLAANTQVVTKPTIPFKREPIRLIEEPKMIRVILSSDRLYRPGTAVYSKEADGMIAFATSLVLKQYQKYRDTISRIDVVAGLDDMGRIPSYRHDLVEAQASHVAASLWHGGIPDRMLYVIDRVSDVSHNRAHSGKSDNRRVEVRIHLGED